MTGADLIAACGNPLEQTLQAVFVTVLALALCFGMLACVLRCGAWVLDTWWPKATKREPPPWMDEFR